MGGCTASKLDNEDTVRRCKERRRLMKEAVYARHNLATAHSEYLRSLRLTGSALLEFASGEPLSVSDESPAILLRNHNHQTQNNNYPPPSSSSSFRYNNYNDNKIHTPPQSQPPPPPPPATYFSPSPSSSSSSSFRSPTIASSKLPHILSQSSLSSTPIPHHQYQKYHKKPPPSNSSPTHSHYATSTISQESSSVWNWENFYPPSPPTSEFFSNPPPPNLHHHHLENEREEVHCSDWGGDDHYSTTSSDSKSDEDDNDEDDRESRSEIGSRSNFGSSCLHEEDEQKFTPTMPNPAKSKGSSIGATSDAPGAKYSNTDDMISSSDMKMVVRHKDLAEIAAAIKDYFDKAATSANSLSDLLEIGRAQLDRGFRQLKKTVYHSNSVFSSLSSGWTSKPPLAIKYRLDVDEPGGHKSHSSTLERLLAWEKKLYQEVKAREGVKIELEKKLSSLQSQEYRGEDEVKLDKTKASIQRLQSLTIVTSQAASTTSSAILHVRNAELSPQLVELCHGFMYMWRSMNQFHEVQNDIVQQVRGLVNQNVKGASTSELHRQATRHLETAVTAWHSNFCKLIKYQRHYVSSLHGWFKLTLHVGNGSDNTTGVKGPCIASVELSEVFAFLDEWKQALDRLPDTVASEAIKSFVNVIHVISEKQSEETKVKRRAESVSKELDKKACALRNIEKKFYQSYSMVGIGLPDGMGGDGKQVFDARDPLAEKKLELAGCQRRVEDEMGRHAQAVEVTRAMTLNNIQTGLPGVFQAMAGFSRLFTEALEGVCVRSYSIK